jgi:benzoyl-CoA-dihydrodiol lyase
MLSTSTHGFKVNFCKYTNETRLAIEDACAHSGQHYIAACNGTTAGGGYELALACEEIYLVDDGNSAVSLPEVPLLGVLPGTGETHLLNAATGPSRCLDLSADIEPPGATGTTESR